MKKKRFSEVRNSLIQIGGVNLITTANWEQGSITSGASAGASLSSMKVALTNRIRTKNLIPVKAQCVVSIEDLNYYFGIYLFDSNQSYLGRDTGFYDFRQSTLYISQEVKYIAFIIRRLNDTDISPTDYLDAKLQLERGNMETDYGRSYNDFENI